VGQLRIPLAASDSEAGEAETNNEVFGLPTRKVAFFCTNVWEERVQSIATRRNFTNLRPPFRHTLRTFVVGDLWQTQVVCSVGALEDVRFSRGLVLGN
jgi:hypothetical protein